MKLSTIALCTAAVVLPSLTARAQTPFVETTTLTFYWGFADSYITNVANPVPTLPELANPVLDPNSLPTGFQTYTDTLRIQPYTGPGRSFPPAAANDQIIQLLLQRMVRAGEIGEDALGYRWNLTAVREAPRNVHELATNPYRVFLTGQSDLSTTSFPVETTSYGTETVTLDPLPPTYLDSTPTLGAVTVDTGITITLGNYAGDYNEANWTGPTNPPYDPAVVNASGSVSTAFTVDFGALFYEDPLHAQNNPTTVPRYNFHLKRNYWQASASGVINYRIRTIPAPIRTFVAAQSTATATGWFYHDHSEVAYIGQDVPVYTDASYTAAGLAPLRVTLSTIQYQKRTLFGDLDIPEAPSGPSTDTPADFSIGLFWFDNSSNETEFQIEGRLLGSTEWTTFPRAERNVGIIASEVIPGLRGDQVYEFRVRAANGAGASDFSSTAEGTTVLAPFDLEADAPNPPTVNLTWKDGSTVETGFLIERQKKGSNVWTTVANDLAPNTTSYSDTSAAAETTYTYRVRAIHAPYGFSAFSNTSTVDVKKPAGNN